MGRLATIRRLWRNRDQLLPFLQLLEQVIRSATTLAEIKDKVAEGIKRGDLDGPLERFRKANERASDYVKTGQ